MRAIISVVTLCTLFTGNLYAQSYQYVPFPDSARWTYYAHVEYGPSSTFTITAQGDTSIGGVTYTKLFLGDTNDLGIYVGGVIELNRKVWFRSAYGQNSPIPYVCIPDSAIHRDELIYDFSLDSFALENRCQHGHFQYAADSAGLILINGNYRKMYRITFGFPFGDIIEGIGDPECLLSKFYSLPALSASDFTTLICFEDFEKGFEYQPKSFFWVYVSHIGSIRVDVKNCTEVAVGEGESSVLQQTTLHPNPAGKYEFVSITNPQLIAGLSFFDLRGRKLISFHSPTKPVSTAGLPKGVYFVEILRWDGSRKVIKYIK